MSFEGVRRRLRARVWRALLLPVLGALLLAPPAQAATGLVVKRSSHTVAVTLDRLEGVLRAKGMRIIARIPHAKAAAGVGVVLPPMELLLFGNPKLGSQLMLRNTTVAIDLPMKALAWQDGSGQVWLGYNAPAYLARRHHISEHNPVILKMTQALAALTDQAAGP